MKNPISVILTINCGVGQSQADSCMSDGAEYMKPIIAGFTQMVIIPSLPTGMHISFPNLQCREAGWGMNDLRRSAHSGVGPVR